MASKPPAKGKVKNEKSKPAAKPAIKLPPAQPPPDAGMPSPLHPNNLKNQLARARAEVAAEQKAEMNNNKNDDVRILKTVQYHHGEKDRVPGWMAKSDEAYMYTDKVLNDYVIPKGGKDNNNNNNNNNKKTDMAKMQHAVAMKIKLNANVLAEAAAQGEKMENINLEELEKKANAGK